MKFRYGLVVLATAAICLNLPAARADSEAGLESSSEAQTQSSTSAQTNNHSMAKTEDSSEAKTNSSTQAARENSTESSEPSAVPTWGGPAPKPTGHEWGIPPEEKKPQAELPSPHPTTIKQPVRAAVKPHVARAQTRTYTWRNGRLAHTRVVTKKVATRKTVVK